MKGLETEGKTLTGQKSRCSVWQNREETCKELLAL